MPKITQRLRKLSTPTCYGDDADAASANSEVATCEQCGEAAEYDSEMCLCGGCNALAHEEHAQARRKLRQQAAAPSNTGEDLQ